MASEPATSTAQKAASPLLAANGAPDDGTHAPKHLGLALFVIATAQLMIVLDATIVNVALPHIQRALGFSGPASSGSSPPMPSPSAPSAARWPAGRHLRPPQHLHRRRGPVQHRLAARRLCDQPVDAAHFRGIQGAGGAMAAPTALALIATTFPMGVERNRALGVYAGMSGAGGAVGLLLGGILTSYVSWRWVFFVNVPIGIMVVSLAPFAWRPPSDQASPGHPRRHHQLGRAGSTGVRAHARRRRSERRLSLGSPVTIGALAGAVVLLTAFIFIERRSSHAELPLHLCRLAGAPAPIS